MNKTIYRIVARTVLVTAFILLLPLLAMQFTDEVVWDLTDFGVAGVLLLCTGLTYGLVAMRANNFNYKAAVGVALAAALFIVWINLAVGIIGGLHLNDASDVRTAQGPAVGVDQGYVETFTHSCGRL